MDKRLLFCFVLVLLVGGVSGVEDFSLGSRDSFYVDGSGGIYRDSVIVSSTDSNLPKGNHLSVWEGNFYTRDSQNDFPGFIVEFEDESIIERQVNLEREAEENRKYIEEASVVNPVRYYKQLFSITPEDVPGEVEKYKGDIEEDHINLKERIRLGLGRERVVLTGNAVGDSSEDLSVLGEFKNVFNGIALDISAEEAESVKEIRGVKDVHVNQRVEVLLEDSVPLINADDVWNLDPTGYTGEGVSIGIIDTGVDYTHGDLGGCFGVECKVVGGYDFVNGDGDPMDDQGHGTHVAATAAGDGVLRGVAPDAEIYAYKVLDSGGSGTWEQVISGVERAVDPNEDGDFSDHLDIISMSLGGGGDPDDPISQAVDNAVNAGVVSIIAAGNSGPSENTIGSPGTARKAITVGASDKSDNIAYFSSRGPVIWEDEEGNEQSLLKPDIVAPGVDICAAQWEDAWQDFECLDTEHTSISGTSMATPHVAGVVALLKQKNPDWTPEEIKMALRGTAVDLGYSLVEQGYGRIDALEAVNSQRPPTINFNVGLSGSNLQFDVLSFGSNLQSYELSYRFLDGFEWEVLESGEILDDLLEINTNYDATLLDGGEIIFKVIITKGDVRYSQEQIVVIDNFHITQVGNDINYLVESTELVHAEVDHGRYGIYEVYSRKFLDFSYDDWRLEYGSREGLDSGIIATLDVDTFVDGKYQFKIVAQHETGELVESDFFEGAIVLKSVRDKGFVRKTEFLNPRDVSVEFVDGEKNIILKSEEQIQLGGGWYTSKGFFEIYEGGELSKVIGELKKGDEIYTIGYNGHWNHAIFNDIGKARIVLRSSAVEAGGGEDGWFREGLINFGGDYLYGWPKYLGHDQTPYETKYPMVLKNKIIFPDENRNWEAETWEEFVKSLEYRLRILGKTGILMNEMKYSPYKDFNLDNSDGVWRGGSLLNTENQGESYLVFLSVEGNFDKDLGEEKWFYFKTYDLESGSLVNDKKITSFDIGGDRIYLSLYPISIVEDGNSKTILPIDSTYYDAEIGEWFNVFHFLVLDAFGNVIKDIKLEGEQYGGFTSNVVPLEYQGEFYFAVSFYVPLISEEFILIMDTDGNIIREFNFLDSVYESSSWNMRSGDVDNDGVPEIITTTRARWWGGGDSGVKVYDFFGNKEKEFVIPSRFSVDYIRDVVMGDYNSDGSTDLVVISGSDLVDSSLENKEGKIYGFDLSTEYDSEKMTWPLNTYDSQRTRCYGCDKTFPPAECYQDSNCNDDNEETIDICRNPGTDESYCENIEQTCFDNDDGIEVTIASSVVDEGVTYEDVCVSGNGVREYYCGLNVWKFRNVVKDKVKECKYSCVEGACVDQESDYQVCYDSDVANDLTIKGQVVIEGRGTYEDRCEEDGRSVREYFCSPEDKLRNFVKRCPEGSFCFEGTCQ